MSARAAENPYEGQSSLLQDAEQVEQQLSERHRVEIIEGQITVTPPVDGPHAVALTEVMVPMLAAGLHGDEARVLQTVGIWLPSGPADYAVPDLSVVDADYRVHQAPFNCYDPGIFRLVLEVTSTNHASDLRAKVRAYATAGIPVYVIVDRKHERLHVLTDPEPDKYGVHRVHAPGEQAELPPSIGAEVTLDVDTVLAAGR